MTFITVLIWLGTIVMVFDCIALVFLVLLQLPKKEAGAGLAFGGGATDALFGAGSGNVLTKITKYAAGIFFGLSILLSWMQSWKHHQEGSRFQNDISQPGHAAAAPSDTTPAPSAVPPASAPPGAGTNSSLLTKPASATNLLLSATAAPSTNKPAPATNAEATNVPAAHPGGGK